MAEQITPLKRSKELAPLSREHHDGLQYVWKIREGLKNGASISKLKQYTIWSWQQHIKPHFFQEERILLKHMPLDHHLAIRMQKEHENIREFILSLDQDAENTTFIQLCDLLNDHIRFEEREVFAYLEKTLSEKEREEIYQQLEAHPVCAGIWDDEFWKKQ
jgi:hemerythrin-like domain-containing protein